MWNCVDNKHLWNWNWIELCIYLFQIQRQEKSSTSCIISFKVPKANGSSVICKAATGQEIQTGPWWFRLWRKCVWWVLGIGLRWQIFLIMYRLRKQVLQKITTTHTSYNYYTQNFSFWKDSPRRFFCSLNNNNGEYCKIISLLCGSLQTCDIKNSLCLLKTQCFCTKYKCQT